MKEIVKSYFNTNRVESMIEFLKAMTERTKELYDHLGKQTDLQVLADRITFHLQNATDVETEEVNLRIMGCLLASHPFNGHQRARDRILSQVREKLARTNSKHVKSMIFWSIAEDRTSPPLSSTLYGNLIRTISIRGIRETNSVSATYEALRAIDRLTFRMEKSQCVVLESLDEWVPWALELCVSSVRHSSQRSFQNTISETHTHTRTDT